MAARRHLLDHRQQLIERQQFIHHLSSLWPTESSIDRTCSQLFDRFDVDADGRLNTVEMSRFEHVILDPLIERMRIALIVVDFQNDFVDGSLRIVDGAARQQPMDALPIINELISADRFHLIVYTQDWHPSNHISFVEHCHDNDRSLCEHDRLLSKQFRQFDRVQFDTPKCMQTLYAQHCVQDTWGAELHNDLIVRSNGLIIRKGTNTLVDSYSAFYDNQRIDRTELETQLRNANINVCFVCGLAYDVCVAATAHDAADLGFLTAIIADASKGLDAATISETNRQLTNEHNGVIIDSRQALAIAAGDYIPLNWMSALANAACK